MEYHLYRLHSVDTVHQKTHTNYTASTASQTFSILYNIVLLPKKKDADSSRVFFKLVLKEPVFGLLLDG